MPPSVSIILPTYDRLAYLREAVASVVAQTVSDWELIVVDDGSTDESVAWLKSLGDARIVVVPKEHLGHRSILRNIGISIANAEWIAFLDSDDKWEPAKLERQLAYHAENPRFRWSYTGRTIIDAAGAVRAPGQFKPWESHSGWILKELLALDATISLPSVMAERSLLREVGGFDEGRRWVEDYDLWLRLATHCECGILEEPLTVIRTHESTSFDRAEVDEGFMSAYRRVASSTPDRALRRIAHAQEGYFAVWAANKWVNRREWRRALRSTGVAIRRQPLKKAGYRAGARLLWRMLRRVTTDATARVA